MDWFLYDNGRCHERVNNTNLGGNTDNINLTIYVWGVRSFLS